MEPEQTGKLVEHNENVDVIGTLADLTRVDRNKQEAQ
jgi:hypothetical protein